MGNRRVQFFILPVFVFFIIPVIVLFKPPSGPKVKGERATNITLPSNFTTDPVAEAVDSEGSGEDPDQQEISVTSFNTPKTAASTERRRWNPKFTQSAESCKKARGDLGGWVCDGEIVFN